MRRPEVQFPSPAFYETQAQHGFQVFWRARFFVYSIGLIYSKVGAQANAVANKLLSGDINALYDYVEYIGAPSDTSEQDKVAQLLNIMMTANRYQIDVGDILQRFETDVNSLLQFPQSNDMYTKQVIPEQYACLSYELAYYHLHRGTYNDGFKYLMYYQSVVLFDQQGGA